MTRGANAVTDVDDIINHYYAFINTSTSVQKEIEGYFLRQEVDIRKRVGLLDDLQRTISDERRCLELQHQECRARISATRRHSILLQSEKRKVQDAINSSQSVLGREEEEAEAELRRLDDSIAIEDKLIKEALDTRDVLAAEAKSLRAKETRCQREELAIEKALEELRSFADEIEQRKQSLAKKNSTIVEWNQTLEARERELVRCQDELRDALYALNCDERLLGMNRTGNNTITQNISQRELMDDHDMCIVHEHLREEIDLEDEDGEKE
ncbi:unnamed protein product [Phytomonas sp. EM1]|nr:unnamed protein product [Phytomonas sp. EM1]|eukprot:CCW65713.1 unnamed protein product [Phytomonas sp. isolate EM1]